MQVCFAALDNRRPHTGDLLIVSGKFRSGGPQCFGVRRVHNDARAVGRCKIVLSAAPLGQLGNDGGFGVGAARAGIAHSRDLERKRGALGPLALFIHPVSNRNRLVLDVVIHRSIVADHLFIVRAHKFERIALRNLRNRQASGTVVRRGNHRRFELRGNLLERGKRVLSIHLKLTDRNILVVREVYVHIPIHAHLFGAQPDIPQFGIPVEQDILFERRGDFGERPDRLPILAVHGVLDCIDFRVDLFPVNRHGIRCDGLRKLQLQPMVVVFPVVCARPSGLIGGVAVNCEVGRQGVLLHAVARGNHAV